MDMKSGLRELTLEWLGHELAVTGCDSETQGFTHTNFKDSGYVSTITALDGATGVEHFQIREPHVLLVGLAVADLDGFMPYRGTSVTSSGTLATVTVVLAHSAKSSFWQ